ncbi:hypothetical protein, partial [Micromonospora aurantiaca (nom. illeg.)]|uniref:hypothetical protein n=1 Tax=Micromonospora aurantiaca (nom. illeg.) TaxID=47850 RepID=UPI001CD9E149
LVRHHNSKIAAPFPAPPAILHIGARQTSQMRRPEGSNCKIAQASRAALHPRPRAGLGDASIMNLAAVGVRFVAANLMIDANGRPVRVGTGGCVQVTREV